MAFAAGAEGAALGSPLREDHFASHCHDVRPADCEVLVPDAPVDPSSVRGRLLVLGAVYEEASPFDFEATRPCSTARPRCCASAVASAA